MDGFRALADEHGLFLLEDAAQAFGAASGGARVGSWGDMAAFSFFPSKNLGAFGDAGAVAARDPALAEAVAGLLMHGGQGDGTFDVLGYNARLDAMQAEVLLAKLPGVDLANQGRGRVARAYCDALAGLPGLALPDWPGEDPLSHVFHQFTVRAARRDGLREALARDGIASMVYYAHPLHRMSLFSGRCRVAEAAPGAGLPEAERAARESLSLPIGPTQGDAATEAVAASVRAFLVPGPFPRVG
jgi:dTDP-4-amino-4,6-dideoxygalactose transaminase